MELLSIWANWRPLLYFGFLGADSGEENDLGLLGCALSRCIYKKMRKAGLSKSFIWFHLELQSWDCSSESSSIVGKEPGLSVAKDLYSEGYSAELRQSPTSGHRQELSAVDVPSRVWVQGKWTWCVGRVILALERGSEQGIITALRWC